jgi:cytochrome P450
MASIESPGGGAPPPREIAELPCITSFGFSDGRDQFGEAYQALFSEPWPRLLRNSVGGVVVFRNEDLRQLAADARAGNTPPGVLAARSYGGQKSGSDAASPVGAALGRLVANQVFTTNPPLHGPTRDIIARHFMPRAVTQLQPLAERIVAELIWETANQGVIDFQFQFAERLTARFWRDLLGMTSAEETEVVELVRALTPMFFFRKVADELATADQAAGRYLALVSGAVLRTLAGGDNDLVSTMARELAALDLADEPARAGVMPENIGLMLAANLIDGFHTAALGATNAVYALLGHPEALAAVKADHRLVPAAMFEGLRLEPPVIVTQRYALEEIIHQDVRIPAGTPIVMLWGAGNRDPEAFPDPLAFRLDRPMRGDTTFGGGAHICPGRGVARMLAEVVLSALTAPGITVELTSGPYQWLERSTMRQLAEMPVRISRQFADDA